MNVGVRVVLRQRIRVLGSEDVLIVLNDVELDRPSSEFGPGSALHFHSHAS